MFEIANKVKTGSYADLPDHTSEELISLISKLLTVDQDMRPSMIDVLKIPLVNKAVINLL